MQHAKEEGAPGREAAAHVRTCEHGGEKNFLDPVGSAQKAAEARHAVQGQQQQQKNPRDLLGRQGGQAEGGYPVHAPANAAVQQ